MYKKRPFTKEQLMKSKTKKSSIFMISAISIVGVFFLFLGITSFFSELYPYDIYISNLFACKLYHTGYVKSISFGKKIESATFCIGCTLKTAFT